MGGFAAESRRHILPVHSADTFRRDILRHIVSPDSAGVDGCEESKEIGTAAVLFALFFGLAYALGRS